MGKLDNLFEKIEKIRRDIPVTEVAKDFLDLKMFGTSAKALCPFHLDHTIGSFVITDKKGIFKCFACGVGGDVIKFYGLSKNLDYIDAAIELGYNKNIISYSEKEEFEKYRIKGDKKRYIEKVYLEKTFKEAEKEKADIEILNKVYNIFSNINVKKGKKLSEKHLNHLLNERHLTKDEIEEDGYFTMPTRHVLKDFIKELEDENIFLEDLKKVPGFFYDSKKKSYSFMTVKGGGIGIPIKDEEGRIQAIQIRKDNPDMNNGKPSNKYIFFSSSFTTNYEHLVGGVGTGSPIDVSYPLGMRDNNKPCRTIFITEGKFKSKAIVNNFNSIALSVQGVTSWRKTIPFVENIRKKFENIYRLDKVIIAYDADLGYNLAVFEQAIKAGLYYEGFSEKDIFTLVDLLGKNEHILNKDKELNNKLEDFNKRKSNVFMALWDCEYGKGIDDLIESGHKDKIQKIGFNKIFKLYTKYKTLILDLIKDEEFKDITAIPKEVMKEMFEEVIFNQIFK